MRIVVAVFLLLSSLAAAHAIGLGGEGKIFGRLGSLGNKKASAPPPATCSGTGLDFTVPCNSQYIGVL